MVRYGLVELKEGTRGRLIPRVPYDRVTLDVSLTPPRRVAGAARAPAGKPSYL